MNEDLARRAIQVAFESPDDLLRLLRREPELLVARTGLGETVLHYLAVENQLRAVVLLAEAGASIDSVSSVGGTPLSDAASLGYEEMVDFLLARGASLRLPGQHEPTLHEAARGKSARVVDLLLRAGAAVDEQNDMGETAVHLAAESDERLAVLQSLIAAGADLSIRATFEETALDVALREGSDACAGALVAAGAPRNRTSAA